MNGVSVRLVPVTNDNLLAAVRLHVAKEQENFVASNVYSMAESAVRPDFVPRLALDGDTPVGFVLWTMRDIEDGACWLTRLMVAADRQRQGYGQAILTAALDEIVRAQSDVPCIYISFEPENAAARRLYERVGFRDDHRILDGEAVYRLDC